MKRTYLWLALTTAFLGASGGAIAQDAALGRKVFLQLAQPPCGTCHTLAEAGSSGPIGPVLDDLKPDAARVEAAVRNGVGVMPPYEGKLTDEQIKAVAAYVAQASGGAN